jgi:hypothetical protein
VQPLAELLAVLLRVQSSPVKVSILVHVLSCDVCAQYMTLAHDGRVAPPKLLDRHLALVLCASRMRVMFRGGVGRIPRRPRADIMYIH